MTTYRIEIKTKTGYDLHSKTTDRKSAMRKSQDLAAAGYDGRIVTAKGHVTQEWAMVGCKCNDDPEKTMRTIRLFGGDLGREEIKVRCDLVQASAPIQIDYCEGSGWQSTQYQCADVSHRVEGMADKAKLLAARAVEMPSEEFSCDWEEV